jgi:hypothetical protein
MHILNGTCLQWQNFIPSWFCYRQVFDSSEHLQGVTKLRNLEESSNMWFLKPSFRLETDRQKRKCEWL